MIPTTVEMTLSYYQINSKLKQLISASVQFTGYIKPEDFQKNTSGYAYSLKLNYLPLSHTDLMIAFAMPWPVYFTMYLFFGSLCVIIIAFLTLYHKLVTRRKKSTLYFWQYIKLYLPHNFFGLVYSVGPQMIYIIVIAVFFSQHLMTFSLNSLWCEATDTTCNSRLWLDSIYVGSELAAADKTKLQYSRFGWIIIHAGAWLHWRSVQLMTIRMEEKEAKKDNVSFDKNTWNVTSWKRFNYAVLNMLTIVLNIFFVYISFTNLFGQWFWWFIAGFKVLGIIIESIAELLLEDNLMLCSVSITFDLMEGLCTFGAPDFLEFIKSFLLGLSVQYSERVYLDPIVDIITDFTVEKINGLTIWFKILMGEMKNDEEDEVEIEGDELSKVDENDLSKSRHSEENEEDDLKSKNSKGSNNREENKSLNQSIEQSQYSDILLTEGSFNQLDIDEMNRMALFMQASDSNTGNVKKRELDVLQTDLAEVYGSNVEFEDIANNKFLYIDFYIETRHQKF